MSDKPGNIITVPHPIMTFYCYHLISIIVGSSEGLLSVNNNNFCLSSLSRYFRFKLTSSLPRQARNICWNFGLLVNSTICSFLVHPVRVCTPKWEVHVSTLIYKGQTSFKFRGLCFRVFGCFVFKCFFIGFWVLRASVFVFKCFVFKTTPAVARQT